MRRAAAGFAAWIGLAAIAGAATLTVPGQYATINAAIQAAQPGDEIVVSPGQYNGFALNKRVTVRSTYDGIDWNLVETTVLKEPSTNGAYVGVVASSITVGAVIRGFKMTRDPVTPSAGMHRYGITSDGADIDIDSCIIENCVTLTQGGSFNPPLSGAAIKGIEGTIQNCIIRNNVADGSVMDQCRGIFRNNVMYNDTGGSVGNYVGDIVNNTFYNETGTGALSGHFINNILWQDSAGAASFGGIPPGNCIIKGYTGPGSNIITLDPKFVDPAHGDFHLQATSPAIDAGITTATTSKADINGVQRGLKGTPPLRGDGSAIDIGAYEFLPQPIAVWFPGGPPDAIHPGDMLSVAWQIDANLGPQINLALHQDLIPRGDFGAFQSAAGETTATLNGRTTVALPLALPYSAGYAIRATSLAIPSATGQTPFFAILGIPSAVRPREWNKYR